MEITGILEGPASIGLRRQVLTTYPRIVCLCGSTRFKDEFTRAGLEKTLAGEVVLTIGCNMKADTDIFGHLSVEEFAATKQRLDELHKRKIDLADYVHVLNVNGYVGESTRSEVMYALRAGKPVEWRYPEQIPAEFDLINHELTCTCELCARLMGTLRYEHRG